MTVNADLLVFGGMDYEDWTAYHVPRENCGRPADTFRDTTWVDELFAHRNYLV